MNYRHSLRLSVVVLAAIAGSLATPASAAPPRELGGTYQIVGGTERVDRESGNVLHSEFTLFSALDGDFVSGASTPLVTHYDCIEVIGRYISCRTQETFAGTIVGIGEGITEGRGWSRCDLTTGACAGSSTFRGISADLTDVRGTTRSEGPILAPGTFSSRLNQY